MGNVTNQTVGSAVCPLNSTLSIDSVSLNLIRAASNATAPRIKKIKLSNQEAGKAEISTNTKVHFYSK